MRRNEHFLFPDSLAAAMELVAFEPLVPGLPDLNLQSLAVFVRDHKDRELPVSERSLEIHYEGFVFSQTRKGIQKSREALRQNFGPNPQVTRIAGREGRLYPLGPEPEPDDVDPRSPAVVVWRDGDMFYLIASEVMDACELLDVARSVY